jgi:hypothetical protein
MTATVSSLDAKRRTAPSTCECPRHQLDALADRVRALLDRAGDALLIPREHLATVLDDLTATTDGLVPPTERTNP